MDDMNLGVRPRSDADRLPERDRRAGCEVGADDDAGERFGGWAVAGMMRDPYEIGYRVSPRFTASWRERSRRSISTIAHAIAAGSRPFTAMGSKPFNRR